MDIKYIYCDDWTLYISTVYGYNEEHKIQIAAQCKVGVWVGDLVQPTLQYNKDHIQMVGQCKEGMGWGFSPKCWLRILWCQQCCFLLADCIQQTSSSIALHSASFKLQTGPCLLHVYYNVHFTLQNLWLKFYVHTSLYQVLSDRHTLPTLSRDLQVSIFW